MSEEALSKEDRQAAAVQGLIRSTRKGKTLWLCAPLLEDVTIKNGVLVRTRTYTAGYKRVWYQLRETTPVRFGSRDNNDSRGNARFVPVHPSEPPKVELVVVDNVCIVKHRVGGADIAPAVDELYAVVMGHEQETE